ncbi:putative thioredoxin O1, mitochondrial-like isoform 3 [Capsicum annuum]|nr:putative thioredoxin O1, mitochondrial-like isoform 3 [Capsicum annuum]
MDEEANDDENKMTRKPRDKLGSSNELGLSFTEQDDGMREPAQPFKRPMIDNHQSNREIAMAEEQGIDMLSGNNHESFGVISDGPFKRELEKYRDSPPFPSFKDKLVAGEIITDPLMDDSPMNDSPMPYEFDALLHLGSTSALLHVNQDLAKNMVIMVPSMRMMAEDSDDPFLLVSFNPMDQDTSFIVWNTRRVNNDSFKMNLKEIIRNHNLCLVALLETKMTNHASLKDHFAFDEMFEVPAIGHSGRLVLMWYSHVITVTQKFCIDQEVHAMIQDNLIKYAKTIHGPWLLAGDFNETLSHRDKWGGRGKYKFILWICSHDRLPTMEYLYRLQIVEQPTCPICKSATESVPHIFLDCFIAQKFWLDNGLNICYLDFSSSHWLTVLKEQYFPSLTNSTVPYTWLDFLPFALWHIRLNRNNNIHKQATNLLSSSMVTTKLLEFITMTHNNPTVNLPITIDIFWFPPVANTFKLNVDGSYNKISIKGGIDEVIQKQQLNRVNISRSTTTIRRREDREKMRGLLRRLVGCSQRFVSSSSGRSSELGQTLMVSSAATVSYSTLTLMEKPNLLSASPIVVNLRHDFSSLHVLNHYRNFSAPSSSGDEVHIATNLVIEGYH